MPFVAANALVIVKYTSSRDMESLPEYGVSLSINGAIDYSQYQLVTIMTPKNLKNMKKILHCLYIFSKRYQ